MHDLNSLSFLYITRGHFALSFLFARTKWNIHRVKVNCHVRWRRNDANNMRTVRIENREKEECWKIFCFCFHTLCSSSPIFAFLSLVLWRDWGDAQRLKNKAKFRISNHDLDLFAWNERALFLSFLEHWIQCGFVCTVVLMFTNTPMMSSLLSSILFWRTQEKPKRIAIKAARETRRETTKWGKNSTRQNKK